MPGDADSWCRLLAVNRCIWANDISEDPQNFSVSGVAAGFFLGVDKFVVNFHFESPIYPSGQSQIVDDVLVVGERITNHAYDAGRIILGDVGSR